MSPGVNFRPCYEHRLTSSIPLLDIGLVGWARALTVDRDTKVIVQTPQASLSSWLGFSLETMTGSSAVCPRNQDFTAIPARYHFPSRSGALAGIQSIFGCLAGIL